MLTNKFFTNLDFIPEDVREVMRRLRDASFDVWLVGGAVRDLLSNSIPKDWDLATSARAEQVMNIFRTVVPIGIRHGTVLVRTRKRGIEVTTFAPSGIEGLLVDLNRRDFTVNAIGISYPEGKLVDPHRGAKDLQYKLLRGVGDPRSRFREDPLRTLRAGRFVSTDGFSIEEFTFEAIRMESHGLRSVAVERIREELLKMLMGEEEIEAFQLMKEGRVLEVVLPEILLPNHAWEKAFPGKDVFHHMLQVVKFCPGELAVRVAAMLSFTEYREPPTEQSSLHSCAYRMVGRPAFKVMERLRMPVKLMEKVMFLIDQKVPTGTQNWTDAEVRRFISHIGVQHIHDVLALANAERLANLDQLDQIVELQRLSERIRRELDQKNALGIEDLPVSGRDVMEILKFSPGPRVGQTLDFLKQKVLENPALNNREMLLDLLRKKRDAKS